MSIAEIIIRETTDDDLSSIMDVEEQAFGSNEESNLVLDLLNDETAKPALSLLAFSGSTAVGHILFTRVYSDNSEYEPLMHILAPLAVSPDYQGKGIGGKLIKKGLELLRIMSSEVVFVLGHENYYPKFGFMPDANRLGFAPPYPIPDKNADAWMVQVLDDNKVFDHPLKIRCADQLSKPEYWKE